MWTVVYKTPKGNERKVITTFGETAEEVREIASDVGYDVVEVRPSTEREEKSKTRYVYSLEMGSDY